MCKLCELQMFCRVNIINIISHQSPEIGNMDGQVKLEETISVVAISDI